MQESERIEYRERSEGEKKREGGAEGGRYMGKFNRYKSCMCWSVMILLLNSCLYRTVPSGNNQERAHFRKKMDPCNL